jgi:AraC family transcriptional regulator
VGLDVGYANPSHFARAFRKATGLSPSDYRQQR